MDKLSMQTTNIVDENIRCRGFVRKFARGSERNGLKL